MNGTSLSLVGLYLFLGLIGVNVVSKRDRWLPLLILSVAFYYFIAGNNILIIFLIAVISYLGGKLVGHHKIKVAIPILLLLLPLILYKILNEGSHFDNFVLAKGPAEIPEFRFFVQVIGLSYITFNAISYLMDLKRGYVSVIRNPFKFLLYLMYFPIVFSGPLHRVKYLMRQFENIEVTASTLSRGFRLLLWSLFLNLVIAQRLFILMQQLLDAEIHGFYRLVIGLVFFLYLYCNFSSYINFFQGVSLLFNINLKNNFGNRIYLSSSRQQFWKGWHITLNEWFRDYFFFVISKKDRKRRYTDLFLLVTFLLIALWHELSMVLVIWGILNGTWIVLEKKFSARITINNKTLKKIIGVVYHLGFASLLALVFISGDIRSVLSLVTELPSIVAPNKVMWTNLVILVFCFAIMDLYFAWSGDARFDEYIGTKPAILRWMIYYKFMFLILVFGTSGMIDNYYIQF